MEKVSAGIIEKDGKVLIAKRKTGTCVGKHWEFPGGKLEEGETIRECLKREIFEELNIDIEILDYFATSQFSCKEKEIELIAFRAKFLSGDLQLNSHDEIKWVNLSELTEFEFTIPDVPIVHKLLEYSQ